MAKSSEKITLSINVSGNGNLEIKQINENLNQADESAKKTSKSVNKIGDSASNSQKQVSTLSSSIGKISGLVAGLSFGALVKEAYEYNAEWERVNATLSVTSNNFKKIKNDIEKIRNIKGISIFDPQDIKESINLLNTLGTKNVPEAIKNIGDVAQATNQNIVSVTEQVRSVLAGETGTLDDTFKTVTKTLDGIVVTFINKQGIVEKRLLKTQEDYLNATKARYKGAMESISKTTAGQARVVKEKFFNVIGKMEDDMIINAGKISEEMMKLFSDPFIYLNKQIDDSIKQFIKLKNIITGDNKVGTVNKFLLEDEDVKKYLEGEKQKQKEISKTKEEIEKEIEVQKNNAKVNEALTKTYIENISKINNAKDLEIAKEKQLQSFKLTNTLDKSLEEETKKATKKRLLEIKKANKEILTEKINNINRQIEILKAGKEKEILILEDARQKELLNVSNPELISAINKKYDIELNLLKDKLAKEKQLKENQTLASIDSQIQGLGQGFADTTQGMTEAEKNEIKLQEINDYYDKKQALLEEKKQAEILQKKDFAQTEIEIEENKKERIIAIRQQLEESKMQELQNVATGLDGISSIFASFDKITGKQSKESFEAQKAFAIASATINAYMGASKALAEGGPFLGPVLAGVQLASGLAQVAQISSQTYQPKFHDGGIITNNGALSNEVNATLQTGEGVLSRRGMSALDKLNRGETGSEGGTEVIIVNNMEEALERQLTSRKGRSMIKEIAG